MFFRVTDFVRNGQHTQLLVFSFNGHLLPPYWMGKVKTGQTITNGHKTPLFCRNCPSSTYFVRFTFVQMVNKQPTT